MKKLIIGLLVLFSSAIIADEQMCTEKTLSDEHKETLDINTKVPTMLEGATIIVRLKNGKEISKNINEFKVVPRKQQFIVTKVETNKVTRCDSEEYNKNRVSILGGYGRKSSLKTTATPGLTEVETERGFVGGLQYQRSLSKRFSIGVQGQTNKTGSLILGIDF